jgi:predicted HTH domain antitoxin
MAYDETRTDIDHLAIAVEQLEVTIELFLSGRSFASAVTLAGAADGVFQKTLAARREQTSLETSFEAMDQLQAAAPRFGDVKNTLDRKARFKAFCDRRNLERDLFKHGPRKGLTRNNRFNEVSCLV